MVITKGHSILVFFYVLRHVILYGCTLTRGNFDFKIILKDGYNLKVKLRV